jgi:hypothetical protein
MKTGDGPRFLAAALAAAFVGMAGAQVLGNKPGYLEAVAESFPNAQAITRRIWAPGLEEGFAPQGLAVVGRHVLVSAYQDADASRPACRVFRLEVETGKPAGSFDLPAACRHAGGIADIGGGYVVVADTRQLYRVELEPALKSGHAEGSIRGVVRLPSGMGAAFTFFDGKDPWVGVYTVMKDAAKAKIYRLDMATFDRFEGQVIAWENAVEIVSIPPLAQGGVFDAAGDIWLSASSSQIGRLYRIDRKTGKVLARYEMVPGIEGISFDSRGKLWGVSEAGARKYMHWNTRFPVIFEIDVAKLK